MHISIEFKMGTLASYSKFGIAVLGILLIPYLGLVNGLATDSSKNVTLIVVGRSGSGISATVRELVGPNRILTAPTGLKTPIQEHLVPIPGQVGSFLKVAEVEGLVDGNSLEKDASIISSLESYLSYTSGLNSSPPDFFLFVSNFDDDRILTKNSILVETIELISKLQDSLYNSTSQENTIFLLTKYCSTTRATQRRPAQRLQQFVETIGNRTSFNSPSVLLGENDWLGYDLKLENGYPKLLNGDKYPENVFDKMELIAREANDSQAAKTIRIFRDMRNTGVYSNYFVGDKPPVPKAEVEYSNSTEDQTDQEELIDSKKIGPASSELPLPTPTTTIPTATPLTINRWWETMTRASAGYPSLTTTRSVDHLEGNGERPTASNNISTSTTPTPITSRSVLAVPEYSGDPIGKGYQMLKELVLPNSPFKVRSYETRFKNIDLPCKVVTDLSFNSLTSYVENRLRNSFKFHLPLPPNPERHFSGRMLPGNRVTGLTDHARRYVEVRTDKSVLMRKDNFQLNERFWRDFSSLPSFDYSSPLPDCGGKMRWKQFFDKYGTHFVNSLYMGYRAESGDTSVERYKECRNAPSPEPVTVRAWWDLRDPAPSTLNDGTNGKRPKVIDKLRPSFEFMSYADFFNSMKRSKEAESINEALFHLIKNNLNCDN